MNKIIKSLFIFTILFVFSSMKAQDVPTSLIELSNSNPGGVNKLNFRLYGGPDFAFCLNGDHSEMKGFKPGVNVGFEINKSLGKINYGILGVGLTSGGYERWVNDDPTVASKTSFDQLTTLEIPIGLGFNFGKEAPKGFFTNFTLVNSIVLNSESNYTIIPFGNFEASSNQVDNTFDTYNMGGRCEFGVKTHFDNKTYASFSLATKVMFLNRFSTNTNQYTGLNIAALMGFYF